MENIAVYLERFKNFGFEERQLKDEISKTLKKYLIEVDPKTIKINDGVVRLDLSGASKSEFLLKKDLIEKDIISNLGGGKNKIGKII